MTTQRNLIIDGHNLLFRSYFGVPESAKLSSGMQVNAIYGFFATLKKLLSMNTFTHCAIVFDSEHGTQEKRYENPLYKANRNAPEVSMFEQLEVIKQILSLLKLQYFEDQACEADDIAGTLAYSLPGISVVYSQDRDFIQIIDDTTFVGKERSGKYTELEHLHIMNDFGFAPANYLDYIALKGDASDNISGVPGIGEKTAAKLIVEFGTIENILEASKNSATRLLKLILEHESLVLSNKKFLKITTSLANYGAVAIHAVAVQEILPTTVYLKKLGYT